MAVSLDQSILELALSTKERSALDALGVKTVADLITANLDAILDLGQYGYGTLWKLKTRRRRIERQLRDFLPPVGQLTEQTPIKILGLGTKERRALEALEVSTVGGLLSLDLGRVLQVEGCGQLTVDALRRRQSRMRNALHGEEVCTLEQITACLGSRARHVLRVLNINTTGELKGISEDAVLSISGAGHTTWLEIARAKDEIRECAVQPQQSVDRNPSLSDWRQEPATNGQVALLPLFSGFPLSGLTSQTLHPTYQADLPIDDLPIPARARSACSRLGISTLGELLLTSPDTLTKQGNFGESSLGAMRRAAIECMGLDGKTVNVPTDDFESMVGSYVCASLSDRRTVKCVLGRLKPQSERADILDTLAGRFRCTKENVRRISDNGLTELSRPVRLRYLSEFWHRSSDVIAEHGGIIELQTLAQILAAHFHWPATPYSSALGRFLGLHKSYSVLGDSVCLPGYKCLQCPTPADAILQVASAYQEVDLSFLSAVLKASCEKMCKQIERIPERFGPAFFAMRLGQSSSIAKQVRMQGGIVYGLDRWILREGSVTEAASQVLKMSKKPMHFTEVARVLSEVSRNKDTSEATVHNVLANSPEVLLWGRGTFTHVDNLTLSDAMLGKMLSWLAGRFAKDIPCLSVLGMFSHFKAQCMEAGAPTPQALYSCLRRAGHSTFTFPRYPYIYKGVRTSSHIPVTAQLEEVVLAAGEPVPFDEIWRLARKEMLLSEVTFVQSLNDIPSVVKTDDNRLVHIDNLDLDWNTLGDAISNMREEVERHMRVSIVKIYKARAVRLRRMGVTGPKMLYSLFRTHECEGVDFPKYPQVRAVAKEGQEGLGSVQDAIVAFVEAKQGPCSFAELEDHFVRDLGFRRSYVLAVAYSNSVFRCMPQCVVHQRTIGWNEEMQRQIEDAARQVFESAVKRGKHCALVESLVEQGQELLPNLDKNCFWTDTLAADILRKSTRFAVLGSRKNAYVLIPNSRGITSLDDLLCLLLRERHSGAANLREFSDFLVSEGIVGGGLKKSNLSEDHLEIVGAEIRLKELA